MFSVGDTIMYGSMGVCTVEGIGVPDLPGATRECYILKPHYVANSKVYAPVQGNPVSMRALLTRAQAQTLIDELPDLQPFPPCSERQEMHNVCRGAIKSADSYMLARLVKTLYEKRLRVQQQKKIVPTAEKEYFDTAEKMLYGEIAVALQMPIDGVERYIFTRLEAMDAPVAAVS